MLRRWDILQRLIVAACCALALALPVRAVQTNAQLTATISVLSLTRETSTRVSVEGTFKSARRAWSFRESYATARDISQRLKDISFYDATGARVAYRQLAPGELETERAVSSFRYEVDLRAPLDASQSPYASWLTLESGLLMTGDLLPQASADAEIKFNVPSGWTLATLETKRADGAFTVGNVGDAVFLIGRDLRLQTATANQCRLDLVTSGEWSFDDAEISSLSGDIFREHIATARVCPRRGALLMLLPFPRPVGGQRWSAETRGGTIVFLSGRLPAKTQSLANLSVPLAHEMFHLWLPNSLALSGSYDWFYEGFTQYQALRTGVRLGWLTFAEFLTAIADAAAQDESYRASAPGVSLLDASAQRWRNRAQVVYTRSLVIAFLYDLRLRAATKNKRGLSDVFNDLLTRYGQTKTGSANTLEDGNKVVLTTLTRPPQMSLFVKDFIAENKNFDLANELSVYGLHVAQSEGRKRISVVSGLSKKQRELLRVYGYQPERVRK